jgi:hypothetical protein
MKKNGVAPTALTYRAILEGVTMSKEPIVGDTALIRKVHDIYEEFEAIWRRVNSKQGGKKTKEEENLVENPAETSTARSFAASKKEMEENLLAYPAAFDFGCLYYLSFLFSIKAYDQAIDLLERSEELASLVSAGQIPSKLPFMLSSRLFYELLRTDMEVHDNLREAIVKAYKTVMTSLQKDRTLFLDTFRSSTTLNPGFARREVDRALNFAMSTLSKVSKLTVLSAMSLTHDLFAPVRHSK